MQAVGHEIIVYFIRDEDLLGGFPGAPYKGKWLLATYGLSFKNDGVQVAKIGVGMEGAVTLCIRR